MKLPIIFVPLAILSQPAAAGEITAAADPAIDGKFDIVRAAVTAAGGELGFAIDVTGTAGGSKPAATGTMPSSAVHAYVWPTSLDSAAVGFEAGEGIVALAVTAHPDFDDTPAYDENGDCKADNDGNDWHAHWVVLTKDEACGAGLKVKDVAPGTTVKMPSTAPGVPLLLDNPAARPSASGGTLTISLPAPEGSCAMSFDAVTAALRVNGEMKAPLLCVSDLFKIASGDLSLPGKAQ